MKLHFLILTVIVAASAINADRCSHAPGTNVDLLVSSIKNQTGHKIITVESQRTTKPGSAGDIKVQIHQNTSICPAGEVHYFIVTAVLDPPHGAADTHPGNESQELSTEADSPLGFPEAPTNVQVSAINEHSVDVTWCYNSPVSVRTFMILYKRRNIEVGYSQIYGIREMQHTLTSLSPNTEYELYVIGVNRLGRGTPSYSASFTTSGAGTSPGNDGPSTAMPCPEGMSPIINNEVLLGSSPAVEAHIGYAAAPTDVQVSAVNDTSALVTWSYDDPKNSRSYMILYKRKDIREGYSQIVNIKAQQHTITSLRPDTVYQLYVLALGYLGRGIPSEPVIFTTTGPDTHPGNDSQELATTADSPQGFPDAPINVQVSALHEHSVHLTWCYDSPVSVRTFMILYKRRNTEEGYSQMYGIRELHHTLTSLSPNTEYELYVIGVNSLGRGTPSDPVSFTTSATGTSPGNDGQQPTATTACPESYFQRTDYQLLKTSPGVDAHIGFPAPPTNVLVSPVNETSAHVTWSYDNNPDKIKTFMILYKNKDTEEGYSKIVGIKTQHQTITSLRPNSVYQIYVLAVAYLGRGTPSEPVYLYN